MPATITSPTPDAIYPMDGGNWAPSVPLKEFAKQGVVRTPNKLAVALKAKYDKYKSRDYETFVENCRTGEQIANLQTGKLLLMRSVRTGQYTFVKRDGVFSDNKTVSGKFQFYWTKLESEWFSSRPDLDPVIPSDDDQVEEYISDVKIIQDTYSKKFYTIDYERQEFASAAGFGTYISRYRYDPYGKDLKCEILPFPACRWDIRFIPEESGHFIYESRAKTSVLEDLLGGELASDDDDGYDYGRQLMDRLAHVGGNQVGNGKERPYGSGYDLDNDENTVIEMWLQPAEYCDIDIDEDTKTVSGKTIPKGNSLVDVFPEGMVVVGLNNMNLIWAIHPENHKDHIVTGLYHGQSMCGVGKGISDAVDGMKDLNDFHSQMLTHRKTHAMPGWGYNSNLVTEQMARDIGKARKNIAIDFTQAPDGVNDVNQVIRPILPGPIGNDVYEMYRQLDNNVQISMQVTDFSNGLPGVDNKTATGAKIGDANAESVLVPQHLRKADARRRGAIVTFNLFKKYIDAPTWFRYKAKNAITAGKYLTGTEFDGIDVDFEIVANSEIPQNPFQQKDSLAQLFQFTGGLPGLEQSIATNPELAGEVVTAFGAKLSIPKQRDVTRVERKRVEQAKKLLQSELQLQQIMSSVTGVPMDNSNLAASIVSKLTPPISPKEPYYQQKIAWLSELLDTDELQYAPQELRYVIEEMIDRHISEAFLGQAQVQQDQSMSTIMGELPMLLGEQAMSRQSQQMEQTYQQEQLQAQQQQQMQQAQMQNRQTLAMEAQKADIANKASEAERNHQLALEDKKHGNAMQLAAVGHLASIEAAKNKPKATAK